MLTLDVSITDERLADEVVARTAVDEDHRLVTVHDACERDEAVMIIIIVDTVYFFSYILIDIACSTNVTR